MRRAPNSPLPELTLVVPSILTRIRYVLGPRRGQVQEGRLGCLPTVAILITAALTLSGGGVQNRDKLRIRRGWRRSGGGAKGGDPGTLGPPPSRQTRRQGTQVV